MTIESTAPTQARHKPRAQKRSKTTEQQPDKEALLLIDSEPAESSDGDDWYYFWYKIPGQKQNAKGSGKTINCKEFQVSWVKEAMESNTLLQKGLHFDYEQIATPDGPTRHRWRYVLSKDFYIPEPEPDEDLPMTWAQPGNEVAVDQSQAQVDPPVVTDPVARETLRRYDILCKCWEAAGIKPTEEQRAEAMRTINAGVLIDFAMGRIK